MLHTLHAHSSFFATYGFAVVEQESHQAAVFVYTVLYVGNGVNSHIGYLGLSSNSSPQQMMHSKSFVKVIVMYKKLTHTVQVCLISGAELYKLAWPVCPGSVLKMAEPAVTLPNPRQLRNKA